MTSDLKETILRTATALFEAGGIDACSRNAVAARVGCATGAVSYHFRGEVKYLHRAVITRAIEAKNLKVLGWAVAARLPAVAHLDPELRTAALRYHCQQ